MEKSLARFFAENADQYYRILDEFDQFEELLWWKINSVIKEIAKEQMGNIDGCYFPAKGEALRDEVELLLQDWEFDLGEQDETNNCVSFLFPLRGDIEHGTERLFGISDIPLVAGVWATPLSQHLGNLEPVRSEWNQGVGALLEQHGWEVLGKGAKVPTGDWGHVKEIVLDPQLVAEHIDGDLRPALGPLEAAIKEFAAVRDEISALVKESR